MSNTKYFKFYVIKESMSVTVSADEIYFAKRNFWLRIRRQDFRYFYFGRLGELAEFYFAHEDNGRLKTLRFISERPDEQGLVDFLGELRAIRPGSDLSSMPHEQMCLKLGQEPSNTPGIIKFLGKTAIVFLLLAVMYGIWQLRSYRAFDPVEEVTFDELVENLDSLNPRRIVLSGYQAHPTAYKRTYGLNRYLGSTRNLERRYYYPLYSANAARDQSVDVVLYYRELDRADVPNLVAAESLPGILRRPSRYRLNDSLRAALDDQLQVSVSDNVVYLEVGTDAKKEFADTIAGIRSFLAFLIPALGLILIAIYSQDRRMVRLRAEAAQAKAEAGE